MFRRVSCPRGFAIGFPELPYRTRYNVPMQRVALAVLGALTTGWLTLSAQVPQPFPGRQTPPRPSPARPATPAPPVPASPVPSETRGSEVDAVPSEATLGLPIYPNAQFIASYDAGRGQRYYLFGSELRFPDLVKYYQSTLKNRGTLVFDAPATHVFEIGRFREETMAFPPGVTIKDYTWNGSAGYLNPKRNAQPARFPTIIQIVPAPAGTPR
jgi:hypothetical protein